MKIHRTWIAACAVASLVAFGSSAYAFSDLKDNPAQNAVEALAKDGVVSGYADGRFAPGEHLSVAQGVKLIVNGFKLNIDNLRFIKEPKASDYFTRVPDDAWYANAMMVAELNGLPLAKDVDPNADLTREAYTDLLIRAMEHGHDYVFTDLWVEIKDEADISKDRMDSIQTALKTSIADLDASGRFRPQEVTKRGDAALMLYNARQFAQRQVPPSPPEQSTSVTVTVERVTDDVYKATLKSEPKPNNGYTLSVDRIDFDNTAKNAIVTYTLHLPLPGHFYGQVVTEPTAVAFVPAGYTVTAVSSLSGDSGTPAIGRHPIKDGPAPTPGDGSVNTY